MIKFTGESGGGTYTFNIMPQYGYSSILHLPMHFFKTQRISKYWDDGSEYDFRMCEIPSWQMNAADQANFMLFVDNYYTGRGTLDIQMDLGSTPSGFFPFGVDLGDKGIFHVQIMEVGESGVKYAPWQWFQNSLKLMLIPGSTLPAYTPPTPEDEGPLHIYFDSYQLYGLKLLSPQQPAEPEHAMAIHPVITRNGSVFYTDLSGAGDTFRSNLPLIMKAGNAAYLFKYARQYRTGFLEILPLEKSYIFGMELDAPYEFIALLIQNEIKIVHEAKCKFSTSLALEHQYTKYPV